MEVITGDDKLADVDAFRGEDRPVTWSGVVDVRIAGDFRGEEDSSDDDLIGESDFPSPRGTL